MRLGPVVVLALHLGAVVARAGPPPTMTAAEPMRVELRDTVALDHPGATAAFSVDPTVAEASASAGRITIVARSVGSTTISVVTPTAITSIPLTVVAPPRWIAAAAAAAPSPSWTLWHGRYESSTARVTNSVEMVDGNERRTLRAYAVNVLRVDEGSEADLDARTSMPAMALEWRGPRHEVVVFDKLIEHSPLTLDGTTVRGLHVRARGLELHAGVTSPVLYQNVFLSTQREVVLGASYELRAGRSSLTPSVYAFPSPPQTGGSDGVMGSLLYRYATPDDRLRVRGELGWGGVFGAAGDLAYQGATQRAWIAARHQPQGFAGLGIGRPIGTMVDAVWTAEPTRRLTLNAASTAARYEVGRYRQEIATATTEARLVLVRRLAASLGASAGRFRGDTTAEAVHTLAVPVGLHLDGRRFGASATYRYQVNSARNRGGHGGRLSMRTSLGSLHASTFVDAQQDAATIELILREEPALAQLLTELGLTATSPDDLARLLRENATLSQLGYIEGASLDFHPWRTQAGADIAWLTQDRARQQLRLRVLISRTQTVNQQRETRSASLSYARRLGTAAEVSAMVSGWSHGDRMAPQVQWSIGAGIRVRLDDTPGLPSWGRRDIEGVVIDESGDRAPIAGVTVRLDGGRTAVSDAAGRFVFAGVSKGEHRVEAELPEDAYFTGPSRVTVVAGGRVRFGLARAPARLSGTVRDDVGQGIGGILFVLQGATSSHRVTTDSQGRFRISLAEGDYTLDPARESLPAGYDASTVIARPIRLERGATTRPELVVRANRSISGTLVVPPGAAGTATVRIVELDRAGAVDAAGRFVFRGLGPGTHVVEATSGGVTTRRSVELPAGPASIRGIELRTP